MGGGGLGGALYEPPQPMLKMVSNEFSTHTYATIEFLDKQKYFWGCWAWEGPQNLALLKNFNTKIFNLEYSSKISS